jgi:ribonuclease HII
MSRRLLIGTDEAGYGPNLGPLTVTATAWEIPEDVEPASLWEEFSKVVTNAPTRGDQRLFVADSKQVYSSGDGLEDLEVAVLAFLRTLDCPVSTIDELCQGISGADFTSLYREEAWNSTPGKSLPCDASEDHILEWQQTLAQVMHQKQIRLLGIRSRIMFPKEFNQRVNESDSKGVVLSNATMELVRVLVDRFTDDDTSVFVVCDKHGGRNRYDELIASHFDDQFVFRMEEGRERSRYRMGRIEFCFRTRAEELLPVALSSMVSKYLREVLMHQFNEFWATHVPGLKPTQGYPVDARRFRDEIAEAARVLQLSEVQFWRNR